MGTKRSPLRQSHTWRGQKTSKKPFRTLAGASGWAGKAPAFPADPEIRYIFFKKNLNVYYTFNLGRQYTQDP